MLSYKFLFYILISISCTLYIIYQKITFSFKIHQYILITFNHLLVIVLFYYYRLNMSIIYFVLKLMIVLLLTLIISNSNEYNLFGILFMMPIYLVDVIYNVKIRERDQQIIYLRRTNSLKKEIKINTSISAYISIYTFTILYTVVGFVYFYKGLLKTKLESNIINFTELNITRETLENTMHYLNDNLPDLLMQYMIAGIIAIFTGMI